MRAAWAVAAAGLAGTAVLGVITPSALPHAWLAASVLFAGWPLGSMALLLAHGLTGGRWGEALRPGLLAGVRAAPLLVPVLAPLALMLPALYPWARPEGAALPNRFWLNAPFFALRAALCLAAWLGIALLLLRGAHPARLAPWALPVLALTATSAAIDLTMSLDPGFTSSAYGMTAGAGAAVLALSAAVLLVPGTPVESRDSAGKLLLALCLLWAYLDFMQVLIVWQSDLASQTPWYLARARGAWGWVMAGVALAHGAVPVLALLSGRVRRRGLAAVGAGLLAAEAVRAMWTVLPAAPRLPGPLDLCCMAAVLGLGAAWGLRRA